MFYPDIKAHISPSAVSAWHTNRGSFVKSYFHQMKSPETLSMKAGTKIHKLIEMGVIKVKKRYLINERVLTIPLGNGIVVLGKPDSYMSEIEDGEVHFVDYKSGKENSFDVKKLAKDLKMKTTAWLIWHAMGYPEKVRGFIEYIPTEWDGNEIISTDETQVVAEVEYTSEELQNFTEFIQKTVDAVNDAYEKWLDSTDVFINQDDIAEYRELIDKQVELNQRLNELKERIHTQMKTGGKETYESPVGTFYYTRRKTYQYPASLKINYLDMGITLEDAEEIAKAVSVAKSKYETDNDPVTETNTLAFRASK